MVFCLFRPVMTTESLSYRVQRRFSYSVTAALDLLFGKYIDGHYPEWRTETALRYFPIAKDLEGQALSELKMLDVGSGASGIKPYLQVEPQLLVGLDSDFSKDSEKFLIRDLVLSQGERLPFSDRSFEIVICLDVLEHVQLENRIALIKEVLRVASKTVYIGFPTGRGAHRQDVRLDRAFVACYGTRHYFLVEHLSQTLPSKWDLEAALRQSSITPKQIKRYS